MPSLRIDVWSDIACPWCYVGKRRLEAALAKFEHADDVELVWRAFELDPSAPSKLDPDTSYAARLAKKYGATVEQAEGMIAQMTETAAADGLDFRFDRIQPGNTFDAHRLLHLAHERGVQDALKERFMRGYFTDGEPIGDPEALARMAGEAGLEVDEARAVLESDTHAEAVRADEAQARAYGITGVPCFVLAGKYAVVGAQPAEALVSVLDRAWRELASEPALEHVGEGTVCGPDGCA